MGLLNLRLKRYGTVCTLVFITENRPMGLASSTLTKTDYIRLCSFFHTVEPRYGDVCAIGGRVRDNWGTAANWLFDPLIIACCFVAAVQKITGWVLITGMCFFLTSGCL